MINASTTTACDRAANATADPVHCFAAGTWIETAPGAILVEAIKPGDCVRTIFGADVAEVIWVGRREVDCARHADPSKVWPVRVSAHAFGRGMPGTELTLSPGHAVYVDAVLIPIRLLVNGRTVRQTPVDRGSYYHLELARHDVLVANGMPAESHLDTGDRNGFSNGGGVIALHPDFSVRSRSVNGCAPVVRTGPILEAVRRRLAGGAAPRNRVSRMPRMPETGQPR